MRCFKVSLQHIHFLLPHENDVYGQPSEGLFSEGNKPFEAFHFPRVSNIAKHYLELFCLSRQDYFMHSEIPFLFLHSGIWFILDNLLIPARIQYLEIKR